jgi:hypothetical protein
MATVRGVTGWRIGELQVGGLRVGGLANHGLASTGWRVTGYGVRSRFRRGVSCNKEFPQENGDWTASAVCAGGQEGRFLPILCGPVCGAKTQNRSSFYFLPIYSNSISRLVVSFSSHRISLFSNHASPFANKRPMGTEEGTAGKAYSRNAYSQERITLV